MARAVLAMSPRAKRSCIALPRGPRSASEARRFASTTLTQWGRQQLEDVVSLLLSELVTNSLLHAGTEVEVCLESGRGTLRVEVVDGSAVSPRTRRFSVESTTGRGLGLVEELSTRWGVEKRPDGKTVWFEVPARL